MAKQVLGYSGILLSLKRERNSDTCYNMSKTGGHHVK